MTGALSSRAVVFLGPTMAVAEARERLDAVYLPPASQGSVVRAVATYNPKAILLIDGTFQGEPAVRHKEILWALSQNVAVYGASSMGALRAAELHAHGMIGVGLIYRWYRLYALAPDDAVAVLHGPAEIGSPAVTVALVDLRFTLRAAERAGRISRETRLELEEAAVRLSFRDRTLRQIAEKMPGEGYIVQRLDTSDLESLLTECFVKQKRRDAETALDQVSADLKSGSGRLHWAAHGPFVLTSAFLRDLEDAGIALPGRK
jgi:hypothetical protein